ncbi:MAG: hypothetical protein GF313_17470 [Caldithrix sp.]|nr:hypothetical protein [Caldithrix sp.]
MPRLIIVFISILWFLNACSLPEPTDDIPPVTLMVYPYEGAVISSDITVRIDAHDDDEISKVWFYIDGTKYGDITKSPYEQELSIDGFEKGVTHVIQSAARDKEGNASYSPPVRFTIAETPDVIDPSVIIVNPQGGQVVEGTVRIVAHAEDERSIKNVGFFINGDSVGNDFQYPYTYEWNTSNFSDSTEHTIFAKAFDSGNNVAVSPVIGVTVYPRSVEAPDVTPPTAFFLYPVTGSTITGEITVSADLYDNEEVVKSEFYVDGIKEREVTNPDSPWIFNWNSTNKADSTLHTLYIKAYDEAGNTGTSELMTVTIQ